MSIILNYNFSVHFPVLRLNLFSFISEFINMFKREFSNAAGAVPNPSHGAAPHIHVHLDGPQTGNATAGQGTGQSPVQQSGTSSSSVTAASPAPAIPVTSTSPISSTQSFGRVQPHDHRQHHGKQMVHPEVLTNLKSNVPSRIRSHPSTTRTNAINRRGRVSSGRVVNNNGRSNRNNARGSPPMRRGNARLNRNNRRVSRNRNGGRGAMNGVGNQVHNAF